MKKVVLSLALVAMMSVSFVSCKETKTEEPVTEEVAAPAEEAVEAAPATEAAAAPATEAAAPAADAAKK